jgi:hypothetical protein
MNDSDDFEKDLQDFFARSEHLSPEDKKRFLLNLFQKHVLMNQSDLLMSSFDLEEIVSSAKLEYGHTALPLEIGGKEVSPDRIMHYCIVNSTISFLNKNQALRRRSNFKRRHR